MLVNFVSDFGIDGGGCLSFGVLGQTFTLCNFGSQVEPDLKWHGLDEVLGTTLLVIFSDVALHQPLQLEPKRLTKHLKQSNDTR